MDGWRIQHVCDVAEDIYPMLDGWHMMASGAPLRRKASLENGNVALLSAVEAGMSWGSPQATAASLLAIELAQSLAAPSVPRYTSPRHTA